jgi:hypothetical protein
LALPVSATLSVPTGSIHGHAPVATGSIQIYLPNGTTVLTNNMPVDASLSPKDFNPRSTVLNVSDADKDTGLSYYTNPANIAVVWKDAITGSTLNSVQLAAPFSSYGNRKVTVTASSQVVASSLSGNPRSATYSIKSPVLTVIPIIPPTPMVSINGTTFSPTYGIPTTGFLGAKFQFYMNGKDATTNGNYTYRTSTSWATVSSSGIVTLSNMPSANRAVTVYITQSNIGVVVYTYTFTVTNWFTPIALAGTAGRGDLATAKNYCESRGMRIPTLSQLTNVFDGGVGLRGKGSLYSEWGYITGNSFARYWYWTSNSDATGSYAVYQPNGSARIFLASSSINGMCIQ